MGGVREMPVNTKVGASTDNKNTLALLGYAIVCRVNEGGGHVIGEPAFMHPAACLFSLQTHQVVEPGLPVVARGLRKFQLQLDVLEVVREA
ncbi:hypothetical protein D3C72_2055780 [compost metagenome]